MNEKSEALEGKILVTGYCDPDLDGTACMIGYSELIQKQGINASPGIIGKPHRETKFLSETIGIKLPLIKEKELDFLMGLF